MTYTKRKNLIREKIRGQNANLQDEKKTVLATLGDVGGNFVKGISKGVEGIYDAGLGIVGSVGGIFDDGFQKNLQERIERDLADEWTDWVDDLESKSYLKENSFIRNVTGGVGQMLPTVLVSFIPGAGQAIASGMLIASAGGQGMEEALNSGAKYNSALLYGVSTGVKEAATEKLGGFVLNGQDSLARKLIAGTELGDFVSKGFGKFVFDASSEGFEELVGDVGIDPALKWVTGVDKNIGKNYKEAQDQAGNIFLTGAAVGTALQGVNNLGRNISNKNRGGSKATKADNALQNIIEISKNYNESRDNNFKTDAMMRQNLSSMSKELVKMSPEARKNYLSSIGAIESEGVKTSFLKGAFNENGTLSEGVFAWFRNAGANAPKNQYYSHGVAGSRDTVKSDMERITQKLRESYAKDNSVSIEEATQAIPDVNIYEGELTTKEKKGFSKFKEGFDVLNRVGGEGLNFVMIDSNSEINGTIVDGKTMYIAKDTFTNGTWAKTLVHEYTHFAEGTAEYERLVKLLSSNSIFTEIVSESLMKKGYDFDGAKLESISEKRAEGEELTQEETAYYEAYRNELNAHLAEELLGNEQFISDIVIKDKSLAAKVLHKIKNLLSSLSNIKDDNARAQHRFLKTAENLYLNAIHRAGYKYVNTAIVEDEKEEKKYSYETLTKKKDLVVVSFTDNVPKKDNGQINSKAVLAEGRKNARAQANIRNTDTETYVRVDDIKIDVLIGAKGMQHGLARSEETAMAVMKIGDILENSVAINELNGSTERQAEMSYVLLGACKDSENVYAVRTTVSKLNNNVTDIDIFQLGAVKGKKIETPNSALKRGAAVTELSSLISSESPIISIADFLEYVKNIPLINEAFSQDVADNLGVTRSKGALTNDLRYSRKRTYDPKNGKDFDSEEATEQLSPEDALQGRGLVEFVNAVEQMTDKSLISKRKHRIGRISVEHAEFAQTLLEEIGIDIDLSNFELWIDGTGAQHIEIRHGKEGKADSTMVEEELKAKIPWAVNNADSGEIMRNDKGEIKYSNRFFNADGSKAPQIKMYKKIGENTLCVSECVADSKFRRIYITSSYIKKGSNGQLLNMEEKSSPQPTPEASFDSTATSISIHENGEKSNSSDEKNSKKANTKKQSKNSKNTFTYLSGIKHRLNLSAVQEQIDKKVFERWNLREGQEAVDIRSVITELNNRGFGISYIDPVQAGQAINSVYELGKSYEKWRKKLSKEHKKYRQEYKADQKMLDACLAFEYQRNETMKIKDHKYTKAQQPFFDLFKKIQQTIGRLIVRGVPNQSTGKEIASLIDDWYTEDNEILKAHFQHLKEKEYKAFISSWKTELTYFKNPPTPEKELSYNEVRKLTGVIAHLNSIFKNFNKVYRRGKWEDITELGTKQFDICSSAIENKSTAEDILVKNNQYWNTPIVNAERWDGHNPNGEFTRHIKDLQHGELMRDYEMMKLSRRLEEIFAKDKKFFKRFISGKEKITVGFNVDLRTNEITVAEIPLYLAAELYLTSRNKDAHITLENGGYAVQLDGEEKYTFGEPISMEQIEAMYKKFPKPLKELISFIHTWNNTEGRELKYEMDILKQGTSNLLDSQYHPEERLHSPELNSVENLFGNKTLTGHSFNKERVKGATSPFIIRNVLQKFLDHAYELFEYKYIDTTIESFTKIMNANVVAEGERWKSVKNLIETQDFYTPKKGNKNPMKYIEQLQEDVKGISRGADEATFIIGAVRGAWAVSVLGSNIKVLATQYSAILASLGEFNLKAWGKALISVINPVFYFRKIRDKIQGVENDTYKYSKWADVRRYEQNALKAMTVREKAFGKISKFLMSLVAFTDATITTNEFEGAKIQAEQEYGFEIGTEENLIKAGEILDELGMRTQQNHYASTRSAASRSKNEFVRGFVTFKQDSIIAISNLFGAISGCKVLKKKLENAKNDAQKKELSALLRKAQVRRNKHLTSVVLMSAFMVLLARLFNKLYGQDEDDKMTVKDIGLDFIASLNGMMPIVSEVTSFFMDGYEIDNSFYSSINNILDATKDSYNLVSDAIQGKNVTSEGTAKTIRKMFYAAGQLTGVPAKNLYKNVKAAIGIVDEGTGKTIDSWFKSPSSSDVKDSLREGIETQDESLTNYGLNATYAQYDIEPSDKVLKKEMDRLIKLDVTKDEDDKANYSPLGFKIPENLEIDGVDEELSAEDRKIFKNGLKSAEKSSANMVKTYYYKKLSDEYKAYAIRKVYEYYDLSSRAQLTGERARLVYFGAEVGIDILAIIMAYKYGLNNASDAEMEKREKSTKELIIEYLNKFNLTPVQKSLALRALGYSDKDRDELVKSFISRRYNLTKEQKAEFLDMAKVK